MLTPIQTQHIFPVIALVLLTFGLAPVMLKRRIKAIREGKIPVGYFKDFQKHENFLIPTDVQTAARNFVNLFEIPVLFYALIPLLILSNTTDHISLLFSWAFVVSRYIHTIVHVTSNKLFLRMRVFAMGAFILLLLWLRLGYQLLTNL